MKEVLTDTLVNEQPFKIKTNKQKKKRTDTSFYLESQSKQT